MPRLFTFNQKIAVQVEGQMRWTTAVVAESFESGRPGHRRLYPAMALLEGRMIPLSGTQPLTPLFVAEYAIASEAAWDDAIETAPPGGGASSPS